MTDDEAIAWLLARCNTKDAPSAETEVRHYMLEDAEDPDDATSVFDTVLKHNDRIVAALTSKLSKPTFHNEAEELPSWTTAEWLTSWNTKGGLAYVAIMSRWSEDRTLDDVERLPYRLVVGIRPAPPEERTGWLRKLLARRKAQPKLPTGKLLVARLDVLARRGSDEQRDVVAASKDFFADRDHQEHEPIWTDAYERTRAALVEVLGQPVREETFPEWFPEAQAVAQWTWTERTAFLALHQDDAELPFMLTLGVRARD